MSHNVCLYLGGAFAVLAYVIGFIVGWAGAPRGGDVLEGPMPWCDWCECYHHSTAVCITKGDRT